MQIAKNMILPDSESFHMQQQSVLDQQYIQVANQSLQRPTKSHNLNVNSQSKAYDIMYKK